MMKKKLLFVNGHLNVGGIERSLVDVMKNINYTKYDVDLVLFEGHGGYDYSNEVPKEVNIIIFELEKAYGSFAKCIKNSIVNRDFFSFKYRLILVLDKFCGVSALSLAKSLFKGLKKYDCAIAYRMGICTQFTAYIIEADKKVSWWHHGDYNYSQKDSDRLSETLHKIDYVAVTSDGCKDMLLKHIDSIENKLVTIPNMIDCKRISEKSVYPYDFGINMREGINLVSVGRLSPEKNMIACIETCRLLIQNGHNVTWYIIGDGTERVNIQEKIRKYSLKKNVVLLGNIGNPYPYIKKADIFVHPSRIESQGIAILEALALGTPSVVAKSTGAAGFIKNGENAVLVEPYADDIYVGIRKLLLDKKLYEKLNRYQIETLKEYTPTKIMEKIYELIER